MGERGGALLVVRADRREWHRIPDAASLEAPIRALRAVLATPDSELAVVEGHARTVFALLAAERWLDESILALTVVPDGIVTEIPWPMIASRAVSAGGRLLTVTVAPSMTAWAQRTRVRHRPHSITVLAANELTSHARWSLLAQSKELAGIRNAWRTGEVSMMAATAPSILEALSDPHRIVHIATHARSDPIRIEHSGILVSGSIPADEEMLGWAALTASGARAPLVVLTACEAAGGRLSPGDAAHGISAALLSAGAGAVVANRWVVADRTGATFAEAFYRHLARDPYDVAVAVRSAQEELRRSRRSRHPFHWAGWTVAEGSAPQ